MVGESEFFWDGLVVYVFLRRELAKTLVYDEGQIVDSGGLVDTRKPMFQDGRILFECVQIL